MKIRDVLNVKGPDVHSVQAADTIEEIMSRFAESKIRCLVVTEGDQLVGMLTIRDAVAHIAQHGADGLKSRVEEAMSRDIISVTPDTSLAEAEAIFLNNSFTHLPVQEEGKLVGLVTPADVLRRALRDVQESATLLRDYIAGVYY